MRARRAKAAASTENSSAIDFTGDGLEPSFGIGGFLSPEGRRCVHGAGAASTLHIGQHPIAWTVHAGDGNPIIGCHEAVAGVDQLWLNRSVASEEACDCHSAHLSLDVGGKSRLRHAARNRSIADHVDIRLKAALEGHGVDWAPSGPIRNAGHLSDLAGALWRDDIDDIAGMPPKVGN